MSPLTKAFVVLVTILSILLVTLVVPFVAQVDTLREQVDTSEAIAQASQVTINDLQKANVLQREQLAAKETAANNNISALESELAQIKGQNTNLTAQLAKAQSDNDSIRAAIISGTESSKTNTALLDATLGNLEDAQTKLVERSTENTQLIARNNQLEADRTALENANRMLREQTVALNEELATLEGAVVAAGGQIPQAGSASIVPVPDEPVFGKVTGQQSIPGGKSLVLINIGRSDGVVPNQRFVAYRGNNELVATLEIKTVDASNSVAVILSEQQGVRDGDAVVSAPNL